MNCDVKCVDKKMGEQRKGKYIVLELQIPFILCLFYLKVKTVVRGLN